MDGLNEQVHSIEQFFPDNQFPWEYPTNICLPSYAEQLAHHDPHFSPLPSPITAERFAVFAEHLPYGSLHTSAATGTVDFSVTSNPGPCQSQWSGINSSLTHETHASVPPLQSQYQTPQIICGWSRDFEPRPQTVPLGMPSMPQSLLPTLTHSYPNVGQYDAWMAYALDGNVDTCTSPDADTGPSAQGFLEAFADYEFPFDARADPQPSIALTNNLNAMPSVQSAAFLYSVPACGPDRQVRNFECHWITNGVPCEAFVMAGRRNVVEHLQHVHGIKPGEEKARETCLWERCKTSLNKESLARHILTVHLKEGVRCTECGMFFAREDSLKRHLKGVQHKVPPDKSAPRVRDSRRETMLGFGDHLPDGEHQNHCG